MTPARIPLTDDAARLGGRRTARRGGDRCAAGFDFERALAHLDGEDRIEFGEPLPRRLDAAAPAPLRLPSGRRPTVTSAADAASHESCQRSARGKIFADSAARSRRRQ